MKYEVALACSLEFAIGSYSKFKNNHTLVKYVVFI